MELDPDHFACGDFKSKGEKRMTCGANSSSQQRHKLCHSFITAKSKLLHTAGRSQAVFQRMVLSYFNKIQQRPLPGSVESPKLITSSETSEFGVFPSFSFFFGFLEVAKGSLLFLLYIILNANNKT